MKTGVVSIGSLVVIVMSAGCASSGAPSAFRIGGRLGIQSQGAVPADSWGHISGTILEARSTKRLVRMEPDERSSIVRMDRVKWVLFYEGTRTQRPVLEFYVSRQSEVDWAELTPGSRVSFDCRELPDFYFQVANVTVERAAAAGRSAPAGHAVPTREVEGTISSIFPFVRDGRLEALGINLEEHANACYAISIEKAVEYGVVDEEIAAYGLRGHSIDAYGGISGPGIHGHGKRTTLSVRDSTLGFGTQLEIVTFEWR